MSQEQFRSFYDHIVAINSLVEAIKIKQDSVCLEVSSALDSTAEQMLLSSAIAKLAELGMSGRTVSVSVV